MRLAFHAGRQASDVVELIKDLKRERMGEEHPFVECLLDAVDNVLHARVAGRDTVGARGNGVGDDDGFPMINERNNADPRAGGCGILNGPEVFIAEYTHDECGVSGWFLQDRGTVDDRISGGIERLLKAEPDRGKWIDDRGRPLGVITQLGSLTVLDELFPLAMPPSPMGRTPLVRGVRAYETITTPRRQETSAR